MFEPILTLPPYLVSAAFGSNQRHFFVRVTKLAKEFANRIRVRTHASRIMQGSCQLRHSDVAIQRNNFSEEITMRIELPLGRP